MTKPTFSVFHGDALEWLKTLESNSKEAWISDPPSGIGFMNKGWDSDKGGVFEWVRWMFLISEEAFRALKPGAHGLIWAIPRTSHWTAMALEIAGFEIRDRVSHIFGTGMPKNHDISKAIDKMLGQEREIVGWNTEIAKRIGTKPGVGHVAQVDSLKKKIAESGGVPITKPASPEAEQWEGWGTATKPAMEDWWLIRKPPEKSITANVLKHGVGGINIDACRVGDGGDRATGGVSSSRSNEVHNFGMKEGNPRPTGGRWPPHLLLTHHPLCDETSCVFSCPVYIIDQQSGVTKSGVSKGKGAYPGESVTGFLRGRSGPENQHGGEGGGSRFFPTFFYCAKPSTAERDAGLEDLPLRSAKKWNPGGIQGRRDKKADEAIASAEVHSQGLDARGRTLVREDGSETLVARFIPQHRANIHATVKSIDFMRWLCRLITPPGGTIIDTFTGSGTTGCAAVLEGFNFEGSELDEEDEGFIEIAMKRMEFWAEFTMQDFTTKEILDIKKAENKIEDSGQKTLF